MNVGNRIKKRRQELDMTQDELALKMGCSKSAISKVETGKDNISTERLQKFADALDTTVNYLMGWVDSSETQTIDYIVKEDTQFELEMHQNVSVVSSILRSVSKMIHYFSMFSQEELELLRKVITDDELKKKAIDYCKFLVQNKEDK